MTDFADIEEFSRQHAACGGITPSAVPQAGGGYLLTLTCACGATLDRWVTPQEAKRPLPLPASKVGGGGAPPPTPPRLARGATTVPTEPARGATAVPTEPARPRQASAAPPSADLEAAIRAALEAEEAASAAPPPVAPATPAPRPSADLEALMREALRVEDGGGGTPPPTPPRLARSPTTVPTEPASPATKGAAAPVGRSGPGKLNLDSTIRSALTPQAELAAAAPRRARSRGLGVWLALAAVAALAVAAGVYFASGPEAPPVTPDAVAPAPPLDQQQRAALDEIMKSLRQLQAASSPTTTYSVYSSRVLFARSDLERFMSSTAPGPTRAQVREVLDVHLLASAAWRARTLEQKEAWEAVGRDPAIDLCPSVRRVVDFAVQPENVSRAQARGLAVAQAIPLLWECAAAKITALDQPHAEP